MKPSKPRRAKGMKFSLRHLLVLTALIAIGTAVGLAYRKNDSLHQQRDELLSLSGQLLIADEDELASTAMPRVAYEYTSWQVNVPSGQDYELRLGMGNMFDRQIPPIVGSVRIPPGRHRVTLYSGDNPDQDFRYLVYIDGEQAIEKTMGRDWIPGGWSVASGLTWPRGAKFSPDPLQLSAKNYTPRYDFGSRYYFNPQSDSYVTQKGYRLWIDQRDQTYQPASPFMEPSYDSMYRDIGLRDGLRYKTSAPPENQWTFTRPKYGTRDPVVQISAEFFGHDGASLSYPDKSFPSWQLQNDAVSNEARNRHNDSEQTTFIANLKGVSNLQNTLPPVVEMKWDVDRPDEVGLRIADTAANDRISRWRLRILDGSHHLWRELQIGDRQWIDPDHAINAASVFDKDSTNPAVSTVPIDLGDDVAEDTRIAWQSNEKLPLQILMQEQKQYVGMALYQGLPLTLVMEIPASLKPTLAAKIADQHPTLTDTGFPGGAVFTEIQIDLDATERDWIWLRAELKE
ncbi:hypothetical protein Q31b_34520 [Novipirellula aureliae]|uniref:Uncharacterized protein n=1 Tax=Novipirellula aureliae TaxID=2527966 RepID=A0A5C6DTL5_9BACT|nr:hypothetical protein [Novipirellula aureliae]TWU40108.1 hypothetical protein Q31b_34520 [Novipirellula aureliae]